MELNNDVIKIIFDYADVKCDFCKKIFNIIDIDKFNIRQEPLFHKMYCNYDCYLKKYTEYIQYL